ncbi:kinase-like domain-containing protein [Mycena pura]|uniref:Kinase-like domain-containing protein n=1 Tax=Mycena pura TaxID=153505 RepID=A0AAD6Y287_9AGAR|nr:kinase-like domain-containing protein [Mycena pura]
MTVIPQFVKAFQGPWEERHHSTLTPSHIKLRFYGNAELLVHELDLAIQDFIQAHKDYLAAKELPANAKHLLKAHGAYPALMYFEFHIQADLYHNDTNEVVQFHNPGGKRKAKSDDRNAKRPQTELPPVPLESRFRPRDIPRTLVTISTQTIFCDNDGGVQIDAASVEQLPSPSFTEILLLEEAKYFLEKLHEHDETFSADLDSSLSISKAWLAKETVDEDENPSLAAGISEDQPEQLDAYHASGIAWLMEPLRSGQVTKFRGTLDHTGAAQGKLAATVDAFIHFTYLYSKKTMVLCDVQTMKQHINDWLMNVIFDPMVHSPTGNRGPGDHGKKGIADFVATHDLDDDE